MGYKSGFERSTVANLKARGIKFRYESEQVPYVLTRTYHPDFYLVEYGFFVETKGLLDRDSRTKMIAVKQQHPELDIRFVFMNADKRVPGLKQTHGEWATKNGFIWANERIPDEWLKS